MLLDSNIIIYASLPEHEALRNFIAVHAPAISVVSYVEVLGYHRLSSEEKKQFQAFFQAATVLPINQPVLDAAIRLRQRRKMSLGDSLIAATALVHHLTLVTHNLDDFQWIEELKLRDPLAQ